MRSLKGEDEVISALAHLYESRGYNRYRPVCFEEYSLYLENKDFLLSNSVVAFSGAEGKLLALRPDVTLSIVSHAQTQSAGNTLKLFYTEKVYRRAPGGGEFRDINQTGVEVIGKVDRACEAEIAWLVARTLATVSDDYVIDLSHMGYTEGLMSAFGLEGDKKEEAYCFLRGKNVHEFARFADQNKLDSSYVEMFARVCGVGEKLSDAAKIAKKMSLNEQMSCAARELESLADTLNKLGCGDKININFSIANNADYYNGIIFNGYIGGVPRRVLSGGRYDKLLARMGKKGGAIGFALYLGELERFFKSDGNYVDTLILYDDGSWFEALERSIKLNENGSTARISAEIPDGERYGKVIDLRGGSR